MSIVKKHRVWLLTFSVLWIGVICSFGKSDETSYPQATIGNTEIALKIYLPDRNRGFYRAQRFDWSGMIESVKWRDFRIFGPWQDVHDPLVSDAVVGPAEEFGTIQPPGFTDARPGEGFLKIGVGVLRKPDAKPYAFPASYDVIQQLPWQIETSDSQIIFRHSANAGRGYAYDYEKTISTTNTPPGFIIKHRLKNVGSKTWATDQYCHNLVVFNDKLAGPDVSIELPFAAKIANAIPSTKISGSKISFLETLPPQKSAYAVLLTEGGRREDNAGEIVDHALGISLRFEGDRPPSKIVFYAQNKATCLEPFIILNLAPGQETIWATRYWLVERAVSVFGVDLSDR